MRCPSSRKCCLVLAVLLLAGLMPAALATTESLRAGIDVWSYGWVEVDLPEGWSVTGDSTYRFQSSRTKEFVVLITPLPQMTSTTPEDRCRVATLSAQDIQTGLRAIAESSEVPILEMGDPPSCVRYVSITDKTVTKPTSDDFKYGTQGAAAVGHLLLSFTILTNTENSPEVQAALKMIRDAKHRGGPIDLGATAAAATRFTYPGKDWSVIVDLSGFEVDAPASNDRGTGLRFGASAEDPSLVMSMFFEPADKGNDPGVYRAYYRKASFAAAPFEREGIRETGGDERPLLWYTNVVGEVRQHNVNAFLVRDGLWIDVHLSTGLSIEESKVLFEQFLDTLRFAENQSVGP